MNDDPSLFDAVTDGAAAVPDEKPVAPVAPVDTMCLHDFIENPDNPHTISDRAFDRLIEKIKKTPTGLTAKRIAYVYDPALGKFVVYSGNKRLRVLKKLYGDDYEAPADWFQDISSMSEEQRREFIVTANVVEGDWVASLLFAMMPEDELLRIMDDTDVAALLAELPAEQKIAENKEVDQETLKDVIEFKIKLTPADRDEATRVLDAIDPDDTAAAFVKLLKEGKR